MMERFEDFLENVKKVEIEDEEFKKELKNKLFELYDKRKKKAKLLFYKRALSFAIIILLLLLPSILLFKDISIKKTALEQKPELFRSLNQIYEDEISKIILNDEIESIDTENEIVIKKYKSGVIIFEKQGIFEKIIFNENFLKENEIDLDNIIKLQDSKKELDEILINKILNIFKKDERFIFIEKSKIDYVEKIKENIFLVKVLGNKGYWIIILDLSQNKILFFAYPY